MAKNSDRGFLKMPITKKQIGAIYARDWKKGLLDRPALDPVTEIQLKKLLGLLIRYDIERNDPACWLKLAFALALKHESGFHVAKQRGPKKLDDERFVQDVAEIRKRKGLKSDRSAIRALQEEGRYPGHLATKEAWLRKGRASLKADTDQEKVKKASSEAFLREAQLVIENLPNNGAKSGKKRRS